MTYINPMHYLDPQFLLGLVTEREIDATSEKAKYIGDKFFPTQNVEEQTVVWESIRTQNPLGGIYSSRGKAVPSTDMAFGTHFATLAWIKAARVLDPDVVAKVRAPGMANIYAQGESAFPIAGMAARLGAKMKSYLEAVDDQMRATKEFLALSAMRGELHWPPLGENGLPISVNMPEWNSGQRMDLQWEFTSEFKQDISVLTGTPAIAGGANREGTKVYWNKAGADPRHDMEVIADLMLDVKNVDAENATLLMSRKVLSYMAELANIQRWIVGVNYESVNAGMAADINKVKEKIKTAFGYTIQLYDAKWTYTDGVDAKGKEVQKSVRFLPARQMLVLPKGEKIGTMAQAPHENPAGDFVYGDIVWVYTEPRPPKDREIEMDNIVWPLLQQPEGIGVFTVMGE